MEVQRRISSSSSEADKDMLSSRSSARQMGVLRGTNRYWWQGATLSTQGVDFFETFGPVMGFDTMRTVLSVSALQGWKMKALDFQAVMSECPASGGDLVGATWRRSGKECKVKYGLRQSVMKWWKELRRSIGDAGWKSSACDEGL